jgi:hypothetical protein
MTTSIASPKGRPLTFEVRADTNDEALVHGRRRVSQGIALRAMVRA